MLLIRLNLLIKEKYLVLHSVIMLTLIPFVKI
jgi:hypothetical protein